MRRNRLYIFALIITVFFLFLLPPSYHNLIYEFAILWYLQIVIAIIYSILKHNINGLRLSGRSKDKEEHDMNDKFIPFGVKDQILVMSSSGIWPEAGKLLFVDAYFHYILYLCSGNFARMGWWDCLLPWLGTPSTTRIMGSFLWPLETWQKRRQVQTMIKLLMILWPFRYFYVFCQRSIWKELPSCMGSVCLCILWNVLYREPVCALSALCGKRYFYGIPLTVPSFPEPEVSAVR